MSLRTRIIVVLLAVFAVLGGVLTSANAGGTGGPTNCPAGTADIGSPGDATLSWAPGRKPVATVVTLDANGCTVLTANHAVAFVVHQTRTGLAYSWSTASVASFTAGLVSVSDPYDKMQIASVSFLTKTGTIYATNLPRFVHNGRIVFGKVNYVFISYRDLRYAQVMPNPGAS